MALKEDLDRLMRKKPGRVVAIHEDDAREIVRDAIAPLTARISELEAALQQVTAERDGAQKEASDLQNDWADEVAASRRETERADAAEASLATATSELARLRAEGEAKDRVKAQLEVAQNALVKIDRGGKPMREIAARALLDIVMVPAPEEAIALARAAKEEQADA